MQFESDDWRSYGAIHASDPEAWRAANPKQVQFGPFDSITIDQEQVTGHLGTVTQELATRDRDKAWRPAGIQRLYDRFRILAGTTCLLAAVLVGV